MKDVQIIFQTSDPPGSATLVTQIQIITAEQLYHGGVELLRNLATRTADDFWARLKGGIPMKISGLLMIVGMICSGALCAQDVASPAPAGTTVPTKAMYQAARDYLYMAKHAVAMIKITDQIIALRMNANANDDGWKKKQDGLNKQDSEDQELFKRAVAATDKPDLVAALKAVRGAEIAVFNDGSSINEAAFNAAFGKAKVELELVE